MKSLEYIKKLAKNTVQWYNELHVSETGIIPSKDEWSKHFCVSITLHEHVQLEMNWIK